ncbi:MAG: zinc ribbon domain-containing protein [Lachnospiraceae bacterium]|nr:zinc ribbon domain-containing protein [Lachnospiraceae bacterium]
MNLALLSAMGGTEAIIVTVAVFFLALIGTVLLYIFILPDSKYQSLHPVLRFVHEFFKVKRLWLEAIMRAFYVFGCIFYMLAGFYIMIRVSFLGGLFMIFLMPIILRLSFEFLMMLVLITRNLMELNNKTPYPEGMKQEKEEPVTNPFASLFANKPQAAPAPVRPAPTPVALAPVAPQAPATPAPAPAEASIATPPAPAAPHGGPAFCTKCGAPVEADAMFCTSCGNKLI